MINHNLLAEDAIESLDMLTSRDKKRMKRVTKKLMNMNSTVVSLPVKSQSKNLTPKTDAQRRLLAALKTSDQVIALGCAGTGKTFVPTMFAAQLLSEKKISKIILTRPNVASGRSLGFFPGSLEEKMAPWSVPFTSTLKEFFGDSQFDFMVKRGIIEIVPFETMRGRSFENAFIILDECQNATFHELKMFLTRTGEGSRVVMNGDITQRDIKDTGLEQVIRISDRHGVGVQVIEFGVNDVVRSDICAAWIKAFHKEGV